MKKILAAIGILITIDGWGQNAEWNKTDAESLFNEAVSMLSKYPIKQEQKETIGICFKDKVTSGFKKSDYNLKLEVELKRIKENALNECAKTSGIELKEEQPKVEKPVEKKIDKSEVNLANLSATWIFESETFTFSEGGNYLIESTLKKCNGTWHLNNKTITLEPSDKVANKMALCKPEQYDIVKFDGNELVVIKTGSSKKYQFKRVN